MSSTTSTTEEKTLDDIQEIYTVLNKASHLDVRKAMSNMIKGDEYQSNKFKACLEKFVCEYASTNNLADKLKEEMGCFLQLFPDGEIYNSVMGSFREYITIVRNRYDKKKDNRSDKEHDAFIAFKTITTEKKFITVSLAIACFPPYQNYVIMSMIDFEKFCEFVKYTQVQYVKKENYAITFPGVTFRITW